GHLFVYTGSRWTWSKDTCSSTLGPGGRGAGTPVCLHWVQVDVVQGHLFVYTGSRWTWSRDTCLSTLRPDGGGSESPPVYTGSRWTWSKDTCLSTLGPGGRGVGHLFVYTGSRWTWCQVSSRLHWVQVEVVQGVLLSTLGPGGGGAATTYRRDTHWGTGSGVGVRDGLGEQESHFCDSSEPDEAGNVPWDEGVHGWEAMGLETRVCVGVWSWLQEARQEWGTGTRRHAGEEKMKKKRKEGGKE
ncbi:uncharacterized protein LOC111535427, partial [Piliocolobus tephrosceles]|uniref:uncharacterized protein LOC111535427 n=1 Tax=Piliocolobus tephrosceles TaxID=591936 RepID=UPI000E6B4B64